MNEKLSKFFYHPSLWLTVFIGGLVFSVLTEAKFIYLAIPISFMAIVVLLFFKKPVGALIIIFAFSMIVSSTVLQYYSKIDLNQGCHNGQIISNPDNRDNWSRFLFASGQKRAVVETSSDDYRYYDKVKVCFSHENIIEQMDSKRNFYLSRFKTDLVIKNPEITKVSATKTIMGIVFWFSDELSGKVYQLWPGDLGVLAKGLLLGGSQEFSEETGENLRRSGTSHLTAVSGYNVAIITIILFNFLRRRSKKVAFWITLLTLLAFIIMTGLYASVLRAGLMGGLYLVSKMIGRPKMSFHFLILAGFILLVANPFIIHDVGFLLSFMATYGLLTGGDKFKILIDKVDNFGLKIIAEAVLETTVAQIFVLPILIFYFGQISAVSVIANALILPLIPPLMLLIFISLIGGYLSFWVGLLFARAVQPLLEYVIIIINTFGKYDWAVIEIEGFNFIWILGFYIVIILAFKYLPLLRKRRIETKQSF